MTVDPKPRMLYTGCLDCMDFRGFLRRHPKSQRVKIEAAADNMDSLLAEIRKQIGGIGQLSGYILTIFLRDDDILMNDVLNILEAIGPDIEYLWSLYEDPNADMNFRVTIYAAR